MYNVKQVAEWHKKLEEARLHELRRGRELVIQKEEIRHLKNVVEEQERTICMLEEDNVQQHTVRTKCLNMQRENHKFVSVSRIKKVALL